MYALNELSVISYFFLSWQVVLIIKEISSVEEGECMKSEKINNRINS